MPPFDAPELIIGLIIMGVMIGIAIGVLVAFGLILGLIVGIPAKLLVRESPTAWLLPSRRHRREPHEETLNRSP